MDFKIKVDGYKLDSEMLETLNNGKGSEDAVNQVINAIISDVLNRSYVLHYKVLNYEPRFGDNELRFSFEAEIKRV